MTYRRLGSGLVLVATAFVACTSNSAASAADACGSLFDAYSTYVSQCGGDASGLGNRDRYIQNCERSANAPGESGAAATLQSCAGAIQGVTSSCGQVESSVCEPPAGTLATGTPCGENAQCKSFYCKGSGVSESGNGSGFTTTVTCGVCTDTVADGQSCQAGASQCGVHSMCVLATGTCVPNVENDLGGSCASPARCKAGLRCDVATSKCAALSDAGGPCSGANDDCKGPLVCSGNVCAQGKGAGEACTETECDRHLVCDVESKTCKTPTLVGPGAACDYFVNRCKVGACNITDTAHGSGTCPTVIADGQPCGQPQDPSTTCDDYAYCLNGTCTQFDPASCK